MGHCLKGILFPRFIDYTYDKIEDNELRWETYTKEIDRLLNLKINKWQQYYLDNLDLLYHNQKWLADKPYERIDFKELAKQHQSK